MKVKTQLKDKQGSAIAVLLIVVVVAGILVMLANSSTSVGSGKTLDRISECIRKIEAWDTSSIIRNPLPWLHKQRKILSATIVDIQGAQAELLAVHHAQSEGLELAKVNLSALEPAARELSAIIRGTTNKSDKVIWRGADLTLNQAVDQLIEYDQRITIERQVINRRTQDVSTIKANSLLLHSIRQQLNPLSLEVESAIAMAGFGNGDQFNARIKHIELGLSAIRGEALQVSPLSAEDIIKQKRRDHHLEDVLARY